MRVFGNSGRRERRFLGVGRADEAISLSQVEQLTVTVCLKQQVVGTLPSTAGERR